LNIVHLALPPLRERTEDLPHLIHHFLERAGREVRKRKVRLTDETFALLERHPWPGNLRELSHLAHLLTILHPGQLITPEHLPDGFRESLQVVRFPGQESLESFHRAKAQFEKDYVRKLLQAAKGNVSEAARRGRMNRDSLDRLIARHGLHPKKPA
jgi:DNA-binding NtrC family response regulator